MRKHFGIIGLSIFSILLILTVFLKEDTIQVENSYILEAYVAFLKPCSPCLEGVMCKPCVTKYIGVTTEKDSDAYTLLLTDNPNVFEIGDRYRFTVQETEQDDYKRLTEYQKIQ